MLLQLFFCLLTVIVEETAKKTTHKRQMNMGLNTGAKSNNRCHPLIMHKFASAIFTALQQPIIN